MTTLSEKITEQSIEKLIVSLKVQNDCLTEEVGRMRQEMLDIQKNIDKNSKAQLEIITMILKKNIELESQISEMKTSTKDEIEILTNFVRPLKFEVDKLPSNFEKMQKSIQSVNTSVKTNNDSIQKIPELIEVMSTSIELIEVMSTSLLKPQEKVSSEIDKLPSCVTPLHISFAHFKRRQSRGK